MNDDGLAINALLPQPDRLRRFEARKRQTRNLPPGLAGCPASLQIAGQQVKMGKVPLGFRIAGIKSLQALIDRESFVEATMIPEPYRLVPQCVRKIRLKTERFVQPRQSLAIAIQRLQNSADVCAVGGITGIERMGSHVVGHCLVEPTENAEGAAARTQGRSLVRLQFVAQIEA